MNALAIALILTSAFLHAGWNLLARAGRREGTFILRMLLVTGVVGLVPVTVSEAMTRSLPPLAWACVLVSGCCCGAYYLFLAHAYASSDFTVVYPIARALPILFVGVGDVVRGRCPTALGWLGMVAVVCGCSLSALTSLRDVSLRRYWNRTSLWMLLTAVGTLGYTMFDKVASEAVRPGPATAVRYGYVFFLVSLLAYAAGTRLLKPAEANTRPVGWKAPALAACLGFSSYCLVLWAYQLTRRAGYVVAFRQFSIVVGVVLAFALFRERGRAVRLAGMALIAAGLVLVALWG